MMHPVPSQFDHLAFAGPELRVAIEHIENKLSTSVLRGGRHHDWGTENAILPLSNSTYLEVIGPDSGNGEKKPEVFGISSLTIPRLVTWACKASILARVSEHASMHGIDLGKPAKGHRV